MEFPGFGGDGMEFPGFTGNAAGVVCDRFELIGLSLQQFSQPGVAGFADGELGTIGQDR